MVEGAGEHKAVRKVQSGHKAARTEVIASLPNRASIRDPFNK